MAGRAGRSGAKPTGFQKLTFVEDPKDPCPPLECTLESITACNAWLWRQQIAGRLDPRQADAFTQAIRTTHQAFKTKHGLNEIETLRSMVDEAKKAAQTRKANEVADRYGQGDTVDTTFGKVPLKVSK